METDCVFKGGGGGGGGLIKFGLVSVFSSSFFHRVEIKFFLFVPRVYESQIFRNSI